MFRQACPVVIDEDSHLVAGSFRGDFDGAVLGRVFRGVLEKIAEYAIEKCRVDVQQREVRQRDAHAPRIEGPLQCAQCATDGLIQG